MKEKLAILMILTMITGLFGGCAPSPSASPAPPNPSQTAAAGAAARTFTDSLDRQVEIPSSIDRIAPSGPLAQIVLFSLAPEKLVSLSSDWSDTAAAYLDVSYLQLPVTGQLYGSKGTLNLEGIAAVDPQLIIDIGDRKDGMAADMDALQEQLGIPVVFIEAATAGMSDAYRMLGELLGLSGEAEALASYCDEIYGNTVAVMEEMGNNKAKLLYCLGQEGTSVIAKGSYHGEIIDLLADNVAVLDNPSSKGTGNEVDFEQLCRWEPDVILFAPDGAYALAGEDARWRELDPIAEGRYYEVPFGPYNWMGFPPSVNRYMGMIWLSELLYPDAFEYDLYDEAARYYRLFYHCELTQEQFAGLTAHSLIRQ